MEKVLSIAVSVTALTVSATTIRHGDFALGLLVLLGQFQVLMGNDNAHKTAHDAFHVAVHKQI